jgi:hypothetical protein
MRKKLDKFWKPHKKNLEKALKSADKLLKEGESFISGRSEKAKTMRKKIDKFWKPHKKDLDKAITNVETAIKNSEDYLKDKSAQGKEQIDIALLNLQKERLYYDLGKAISVLPKTKWTTAKKPESLKGKINSINKQIKTKKRALKKHK